MLVVAVLLAIVASLLVGGLVANAQEDPGPLPSVVFLARADNPVDALGAGAVAGTLGAPVLLSGSNRLDGAAAAALGVIKPDLVVLAGGATALSSKVEADVRALGLEVRRVSGSGRTQTAAALAAFAAEMGTGRPVVTGRSVGAGMIPGLDAELLQGMTPEDLVGAQGPAGPPGPTGPPGLIGEVVMHHSTAQLGGTDLNEPTDLRSLVTGTIVTGDGLVELPLHGPAMLAGAEYGLQSVEYCIKDITSSNGVSAYIDSVKVYRSDTPAGGAVPTDEVDRRSAGCYTVDVGHASSPAPYTVLFKVGGGNSLRINGAQSTWRPVDEIEAAATSQAGP